MLSAREVQVQNMLLSGHFQKTISSNLHISLSTVKFHAANIYKKHKVKNRIELMLKVREVQPN